MQQIETYRKPTNMKQLTMQTFKNRQDFNCFLAKTFSVPLLGLLRVRVIGIDFRIYVISTC